MKSGQFLEWRFYDQIEWGVLNNEFNPEFQHYIKTLNHLYKDTKALHEVDDANTGLSFLTRTITRSQSFLS